MPSESAPTSTPVRGSGIADLIDPRSADYARALQQVPHDVYHRPEYLDLDARRQGGTAVAYRYRDRERVLLLPLVIRPVPNLAERVDAISPYGYSGPVGPTGPLDTSFWQQAVAALAATLAAAEVVSCFVRLHPLLPTQLDALAEAGTLVQHGHTVSIDLTQDEAAMWSQLRGNHRRQISRARRSGLVTSIDDWYRLGEFVEIYRETMTRVGAGRHYFFDRTYFDELRAAVGDGVHLVTVEDGSEVLGGGLFFTHGGIVQYHLGATRDRHLSRQPAKLMMDEVRRWAKDRGLVTLHLGGGVGGRTDDSLFHFKAGFGRGRSAFITWRLVPDRTTYRRLSGFPAESPDDDSGLFPAYRVSVAPEAAPTLAEQADAEGRSPR